MSKISVYDVVPVPKLADRLIGTSVGGDIEDVTYNFTLGELLNLFIPNIPANNLQGVLNFGNTATQNINLTGTISTTTLNVSSIANILNSNLTGETRITGGLFDRVNSKGTAGQVLISTGTQVEWFTIPTVIPTLQQVLTSGNTSDKNIILTANIDAVTATANNVVSNTSLSVLGTFRDKDLSVGAAGQILSSTGTKVQWVNPTIYTATSPLSIDSGTRVISIQQAGSTQGGYLSSADWVNFDGKQGAITLTTTGASGAATLAGSILNIPNYTLVGLGGVPQSRTLTINGVTYDLSANRVWTIDALPSQIGNNGKYLTTDGTTASWGAIDLSGFVPTSRTITINGTTYDLSADRSWTITAGITGSGVANQLTYWNGTGSVTGSSNLVWNNTNARLGIGVASPKQKLDVLDIIGLTHTSTGGTSEFLFYENATVQSDIFTCGSTRGDYGGVNSLNIYNFLGSTITFGTSNSERARITAAGRFLIGTNSESTFLFHVNGNARIGTDLTIGTSLTISAFTSGSIPFVGASGLISQNNANFFWNNTNARLGIGINAPKQNLDVVSKIGITHTGTSDISELVFYENNTAQGDIFFTGSTYSGAYPSNTLNIYSFISSPITFGTNNTERARLTSAGRLLLGTTTESTFLLDVQGTARVSGNLTLTASTNLTWGATNSGNNINRVILYDDGSTNLRIGIGVRSSNMLFFAYAGAGFQWRNGGDAVSAGGNTLAILNENAQFAVNTTSVNTSAVLQADSTNRGFLPPRMTSTQRDAIASPATGLQVYNTTTNTNDFYNGTAWVASASGNIYTTDGTLSADRTITSGGNSLTILGGKEEIANEQIGLKLLGTTTTKQVVLSIQNIAASGKHYKLRSLTTGIFDIRNITDSTTPFSINGNDTTILGNLILGSTSQNFVGLVGTLNGLWLSQGTRDSTNYSIYSDATRTFVNSNNGGIFFRNQNATQAVLTNAGRLLLGTTTESTFILDAVGSARISQDLSVLGTTTLLSTSATTLSATNYRFPNPSNTVNTIFNGYQFLLNGTVASRLSFILDGANWFSGTAMSFVVVNGPDSTINAPYEAMRLTSNGNLLLGTITNQASSQLTINSTTKGFLPPRMTSTQKNAIASPAQALMVFDTTLVKLCVYNGTAWETVTSL